MGFTGKSERSREWGQNRQAEAAERQCIGNPPEMIHFYPRIEA
jgi:hypothetical protein